MEPIQERAPRTQIVKQASDLQSKLEETKKKHVLLQQQLKNSKSDNSKLVLEKDRLLETIESQKQQLEKQGCGIQNSNTVKSGMSGKKESNLPTPIKNHPNRKLYSIAMNEKNQNDYIQQIESLTDENRKILSQNVTLLEKVCTLIFQTN